MKRIQLNHQNFIIDSPRFLIFFFFPLTRTRRRFLNSNFLEPFKGKIHKIRLRQELPSNAPNSGTASYVFHRDIHSKLLTQLYLFIEKAHFVAFPMLKLKSLIMQLIYIIAFISSRFARIHSFEVIAPDNILKLITFVHSTSSHTATTKL